MTDLIIAEGLKKNYKDTVALHDLSFRLRAGEILGFLGPNGAGKTTTLHILLGLLTPSGGAVSILGFSPFRERTKIAPLINFTASESRMPSNLTALENLDTFARIYGVKNRKQKIKELLELLEITHLQNRLAGALSSGEATRLNLAKCFLNDPKILILDEPTSSLDPNMSEKVRQLLKKIQRERAIGILYTSHNMFEVENLCDRILFIHQGRRVVEGTCDEVKKALATQSLEQAFIKIVRSGEIIAGEDA